MIEILSITKKDTCFTATAKITGIALLSLTLLVLAVPTFGLTLLGTAFILYKGNQYRKLQPEPIETKAESQISEIRNPLPQIQPLVQSNKINQAKINKLPLEGIPNPRFNTCYMNAAVMSLYHLRHLFEKNPDPNFQAIIKSYENPRDNIDILHKAVKNLSSYFDPNKYGDAAAVLSDILFKLSETSPEMEKLFALEVRSCTCSGCGVKIEEEKRDGFSLPQVLNSPKWHQMLSWKVNNVSEATQAVFDAISDDIRCDNRSCYNENQTPLVLPNYFIINADIASIELVGKFEIKGHDFRVLAAITMSDGNRKGVGHAKATLPGNFENPQVWYEYNDSNRSTLPNRPHCYRSFLIENCSYNKEHPIEWPPLPNIHIEKMQKNGSAINNETLNGLKRLISKEQKLPGAEANKKTGEEHIAAILYDKLIDSDKRTDCAITLKPSGNEILPENFNANAMPRYLIIPMSVNSNIHNTVLIIDNEKKEYAYFDSYGDPLPANALAECKRKDVIRDNYKDVDTSKIRTEQKDGWSCGFHAVENAIAYVNDREPEDKKPSGDSLREKYRPGFERFASTHGLSKADINHHLLCERQKIRIKDALAHTKANEKNHILFSLWSELDNEIKPGNPNKTRSIDDFISFYVNKHPKDIAGKQLLENVNNPACAIYENMPKSTEETDDLSRMQEFMIAHQIRQMFSLPNS